MNGWSDWIEHDGSGMPVDGDVIVDAQTVSPHFAPSCPRKASEFAGSSMGGDQWTQGVGHAEALITRYRTPLRES